MATIVDVTQDTGTDLDTLRDTSGQAVKFGQSWKPTVWAKCNQVQLYLQKLNSPSGNVWVTIETDNGNPTGIVLATSANVTCASISTAAYYTFTFPGPALLQNNIVYWLVLQGDYTASDTVAIAWAETGTNPYAGGALNKYGPSSWGGIQASYDWRFKTYYDDSTIYTGGNYSYFM